MYTFVIENLKLVIFWSPRAGSGSMITFLKEHNLASENANHINNLYYQIKNPQYYDNSYKQYLIVYNPYKRFLSFFKNIYLRSEIFDTKYPNRFENINNYLNFLLEINYKDIKYDTNTEIHHVKNQILNSDINLDKIIIINIEKNYDKFFSDIFFILYNKSMPLKNIYHLNKGGGSNLKIELKKSEYLQFNEIFKEDLQFFEKNKIYMDPVSIIP